MGKNLSILPTVEYERTFILTEPDVLDLSDVEEVVSRRMYIHGTQDKLSQRPIQEGSSSLIGKWNLPSIFRPSSEVHAQRSLAFPEEVNPISNAVLHPLVEARTGSNRNQNQRRIK